MRVRALRRSAASCGANEAEKRRPARLRATTRRGCTRPAEATRSCGPTRARSTAPRVQQVVVNHWRILSLPRDMRQRNQWSAHAIDHMGAVFPAERVRTWNKAGAARACARAPWLGRGSAYHHRRLDRRSSCAWRPVEDLVGLPPRPSGRHPDATPKLIKSES